MHQSDEFNWYEFNTLANSYMGEDNEAKQRTGISDIIMGLFVQQETF